MLIRIECTFDNGKFVGYPKVVSASITRKDGYLSFTFGGDHKAIINLDHVLFIEEMPNNE